MTAVGRSVDLATVLAWEPCYDKARLRELAAGRERITAMEILDLPIPARDRLWAALREELIPTEILREVACRYAEAALHRERAAGREPDPRLWQVIQVARDSARGESSAAERAAATDTAQAVLWAAHRFAHAACAPHGAGGAIARARIATVWAANAVYAIAWPVDENSWPPADAARSASRSAVMAAGYDAAGPGGTAAAIHTAEDAAEVAHVEILRDILRNPKAREGE